MLFRSTDHVLVGSLARLTRLRKAALLERLKFNGAKQHAVETHDSPGDLPAAEALGAGNGPAREVGGAERGAGSAAPDGAGDRASQEPYTGGGTGAEQVGETRVPNGRSSGNESVEGRRSQLIFTLGCAARQGELLDLLAVARRTAQPPLERAISDLDEVIEINTSTMKHQRTLAEPQSLVSAREREREARSQLQLFEAEEAIILDELAAFPPLTFWRRFWYRRETKERTGLQVDLSKKQDLVRKAAGEHVWSKHQLEIEIKSHRSACGKHDQEALDRAERSKLEIKVAEQAKTFVQKNPQFALWGSPRLMQVAAKIEQTRLELLAAASTDEDFEIRKNSSTTP